ncbi:MAG: sigma 54-interacting transcriptional regulator [Motiliproteus sp.]
MRLEVACENRPGVAREILDVLSAVRINVSSGEFGSDRFIYLHTPEMSFNQLQSILPRIRRIDGVDAVHPIALMPSEKRQVEQQTLLDSLADIVLSVDLQGQILAGNQAAATMLGIDSVDLAGYPLAQVTGDLSLLELIQGGAGQVSDVRMQVCGQLFQAQVKPIRVPVRNLGDSLTGAVLRLKPSAPLGREQGALPSMEQFFQRHSDKGASVRRVQRIARMEQPLLIEGETGTGKSLLARLCHQASAVAEGPLVVLDCLAMSDLHLEIALFGGLSTETGENCSGLLERATAGVLVLEQVAEMSPLLQRRLLHFIETGRFYRVGGDQEQQVKVRIIATSQQALLPLCHQGDFRFDLYYRLSELQISLPPLRHRPEELPALAQLLLQQLCQHGTRVPALAKDTQQLLQSCAWPGNVRELESALQAALVSQDDEPELLPQHFRLAQQGVALEVGAIGCEGTLEQAVRSFEARLLAQLYPDHPSSRLLGKRLGLSHTAVAKKLRAYGIGRG